MAFGKRPVSARAPAPPAEPPHGRQRVIPAEMWEGQAGAMLRELGLDPNDESNLVHNTQSLQAKLDHGRAAVDAKVARLNEELRAKSGGAGVRPFFLIPDPCWNGDMGQLLMMRLDLFPYDDWNIAFLPVDERTALSLDMPLHPNGNIPAFVQAAEKFMREADAHLRIEHARAGQTQDFARFGDVREDIRGRVRGLAHLFLTRLDETWKQHRPGRA